MRIVAVAQPPSEQQGAWMPSKLPRPAHQWYEGAKCHILVVQAQAGHSRTRIAGPLQDVLLDRLGLRGFGFGRGVGASRLQHVLKYGIDVDPTNAPIYIEIGIEKALEYGNKGDQIIMVFDHKHLDFTWREVDIDSPTVEIEDLLKTFPTQVVSRDGKKLWLSMRSDDVAASAYERDFSRFVPGDPWGALNCLIVVSERSIVESISMIQGYLGGSSPCVTSTPSRTG